MKRTLLIILILFVVMQAIQTEQTNPTIEKNLEIQAPQNIKTMFKDACYDCHSNQTNWPSYGKVAPFSWIVARHVREGRKALDFTAWENYDEKKKQEKLKAIYRTVYGSMPLPAYMWLHEEAELTKDEREAIRSWTGVRRF